MTQPIVLATANQHKVVEIRRLLDGVELVPRPYGIPDVDETDTTFEGNARLKAVALVGATHLAAVADDSGLEVDALGGAPGVISARYAGENATDEQNLQKLLVELADVPDHERAARYRAVALLRYVDGTEVIAEGAVEGRIIREPRGTGGFGYDPIFVPDEGDGRTFAEMSMEEKNAISHRGRAFSRLKELIGS